MKNFIENIKQNLTIGELALFLVFLWSLIFSIIIGGWKGILFYLGGIAVFIIIILISIYSDTKVFKDRSEK